MVTSWELDFYSRPLLDPNRKKVWELLVCESPQEIDTPTDGLFRYSQYCSSNQVNSTWLQQALEDAIAQAPQSPSRIRFFRRQMTNMITLACDALGIPAQPSRRTVALGQWLTERCAMVYPQMPGYQPLVATHASVQYPSNTAQSLPDALRPDQWSFVSLTAGDFSTMADWSIDFGEAFPLDLLGLDPTTSIPGIIFYSQRAVPLAAWMSGLELAFLTIEGQSAPRLILETGGSDRWLVATLTTERLQVEATGFVAAKQGANQVHFLAVQSDPQSEVFAGFWLLRALHLE